MLLAVTAGLSGRLEETFRLCRRWEQSHRRRITCLLQLGDLPLRHDFSQFTHPLRQDRSPGKAAASIANTSQPGNPCKVSAGKRGASSTSSFSVEDLVHGRQKPSFPLIFLAGEQDDPGLLTQFERRAISRAKTGTRRQDGKSDAEAHQVVHPDGSEATPLLIQPAPSPGDFLYLPSGSLVQLQEETETVLVGGLSAFTAQPEKPQKHSRRPGAPGPAMPSRRSLARRLLGLKPGAVAVLLSHDPPPPVDSLPGEPSAEAPGSGHPGVLFLKTLDALQPAAAFHGHARSGLQVHLRGRTTICSLPTATRSAGKLSLAILDTASGSIQFQEG